jgi:hypothetical protein
VLGLEHLEIKTLVLNLVPPEVLCLGIRRSYPQADGYGKQDN